MVSASSTTQSNGLPPAGCDTLSNGTKAKSICLIHFNDVYNVEEQAQEPVAGAARFKTAVKSFKDKNPLILFSGDILAPSIMSSFTQGAQMIPVMNQLGIHCAVFGNHDFDFGLERLVEVAEQTTFPWLMSNVTDNETDEPLAGGQYTQIIEWEGWKIGLMGLVESEWLDTLATINIDEVTYTDYVDKGNELATQLRSEGCDYVIALTHMRTPNDTRLAENVEGIDLILGGHDHVYEILKINGKHMLKSGTDFREFSLLTLTDEGTEIDVKIDKVEITSKFAPDPQLQESLKEFESVMSQKMDEVLGNFSVELDGRFATIRTRECNLGNFISDVMLAACNADIAIMNSGTFRSDRLHPPGEFKMRDLMTVLPMLDAVCVLEVTGEKVLRLLENGVSMYPKLEGRFPQVAGVQFVFNPDKPAGSRVFQDLVQVGDQPLNAKSLYRVATKAYLRSGRDGYDMLVNCPVLQDDEQCPMLSTAVQNHFTSIHTRLESSGRRGSTHRQSLVLLSRRHSLIRPDDLMRALGGHSPCLHPPITRNASLDAQPPVSRLYMRRLSVQDSCEDLEIEACKLSPKVEQRIVKANDEQAEAIRVRRRAEPHPVDVIQEIDEPSTPKKKLF